MSASALSIAGPRRHRRGPQTAAEAARGRARRWAIASLALAALAAIALFWLLVRPVALQPTPLGLNYIEATPRLGTAGMPDRHQFRAIAHAGYRAVINLAPADALGSHADEAARVAAEGMAYAHVPVDFAHPTPADYTRFVAQLRQHGEARVLVHCQLGLRASVFVYLYRVLELGEDPDRAWEAVERVWQPSHQWRALVRTLHAARGRPLPFAFDAAP